MVVNSVYGTFPDGKDKNYSWHSVIHDKIRSLTSVFLSLIQQGNSYHESLVTEVGHFIEVLYRFVAGILFFHVM